MNYKHEDSQEYQYLVKRVSHGDTNAFSTIIKNTEGLVTQIVYKMIPNSEGRKDIAQEVYLKVFQNLKSFRFQSKISTWIAQITYNTFLNFLDKKNLYFPTLSQILINLMMKHLKY